MCQKAPKCQSKTKLERAKPHQILPKPSKWQICHKFREFCMSILNSGRTSCLASWQKLTCKNTLALAGNLNFKLWQLFLAGKWHHIKKCSSWLKSELTFSISWRFFIFWGHFGCVIKNGRLAQPPISLLTLGLCCFIAWGRRWLSARAERAMALGRNQESSRLRPRAIKQQNPGRYLIPAPAHSESINPN